MPRACSLSNKPIGGSKIGCIIGAMSRLGEDACQVRMSGAPQALAALNGGVLALMDWLHVPNVASQMRHFCAHPMEPYSYCMASFCGSTGKPKSPG